MTTTPPACTCSTLPAGPRSRRPVGHLGPAAGAGVHTRRAVARVRRERRAGLPLGRTHRCGPPRRAGPRRAVSSRRDRAGRARPGELAPRGHVRPTLHSRGWDVRCLGLGCRNAGAIVSAERFRPRPSTALAGWKTAHPHPVHAGRDRYRPNHRHSGRGDRETAAIDCRTRSESVSAVRHRHLCLYRRWPVVVRRGLRPIEP